MRIETLQRIYWEDLFDLLVEGGHDRGMLLDTLLVPSDLDFKPPNLPRPASSRPPRPRSGEPMVRAPLGRRPKSAASRRGGPTYMEKGAPGQVGI